MSARTVHLHVDLPTTADRVWEAMQHPASFLYVVRGALGFPALAGRTERLREGEVGSGWIWAFHLLPVHRHTIEIVDVDEPTRSIVSKEHGGVLRRWDHTLHVEPLGEDTCRYHDTVVIDAGPLTGLVCTLATGLYRHRHRRWRRLVRKHLLLAGPAYRR